MQNTSYFKRDLPALAAVFAALLAACLLNRQEWLHDAKYYWELHQYFTTAQGGFSLAGFPESLRGYFLPLLFFGMVKLGGLFYLEPATCFLIFNSLFLAAAIVFLPPAFLRTRPDRWRTFAGSLLFAAALIYFWQFIVYYPMTDAPALAMFALGLLGLKKLNALADAPANAHERKGGTRQKIVTAFGVGFLFYAACNCRSIYQFPALAALAAFCFFCLRKTRHAPDRRLALPLAFMLAGAMLCAAPQLAINWNNLHKIRFFADASVIRKYQLASGVTMSRYETSADNKIYVGGLYFADNAGRSVAALEGMGETASTGQMIRLYAKYPLDFMGIYFRHLMNGCTQIFVDGYIKDLTRNKAWPFILNAGLFFIAGLNLAASRFGKGAPVNSGVTARDKTYLTFLFLPVAMILPGSVETRFFLPVYLTVYTLVFLDADYAAIRAWVKKRAFAVALLLGLLLALWAGVITATLAEGGNADPARGGPPDRHLRLTLHGEVSETE